MLLHSITFSLLPFPIYTHIKQGFINSISTFYNIQQLRRSVMGKRMDLRLAIIAIFILLLLAAPPCRGVSRGGMMASDMADSAIYEIDYRGPETHAYIPPPTRSGGKHSIHNQMKVHHKSKGILAASKSDQGKKKHG